MSRGQARKGGKDCWTIWARKIDAEAPTASEHQIQVAYFEWVELRSKTDWRYKLIHATPNGGYRHASTAGCLKAEGVKAGVPDISIPIPTHLFHGAYIETKKPGNKATAVQLEWHRLLRDAGHCVVVCDSVDRMIAFTQNYLGGLE
jgi:hypothetical protein